MPLAPVLLQPHAEVAERVLVPGDPGRALRLAQALTDGPRMLNHHRGLWGYTGTAADGLAVTVQSSGLGGPGAAAILAELVALGARWLVRVGTARRLDAGLALGDLVVVRAAVCGDGTSRSLAAGARVSPDPELLAALDAAGGPHIRSGVVASTDLLYAAAGEARAGAPDTVVADLETAAFLAAAQRLGVPAAAVLLVSGDADDPAQRLTGEELHAAELRLGSLGMAALSSGGAGAATA